MRNKMILLSTLVFLLCSSLHGQVPLNRTTETTVADLLAHLPAENQATYNHTMTALLSTGEEGVLLLTQMLDAPDSGDLSRVKFALSGITHYAAADKSSEQCKMLMLAYHQALGRVQSRESKAFIIRQLAFVGADETVFVLSPYLFDDSLSGPAARALVAIGDEDAVKILRDLLEEESLSSKTRSDLILALASFEDTQVEFFLRHLLSAKGATDKQVLLYALSRVGTKESLHTLYKEAAKVGFRAEESAATDAYLHLIQRLFQKNEMKEALKAADELLKKATKAGVTETRIAVLHLIVTFQGADASKIVLKALKDPSMAYRTAALDAASSFADAPFYRQIIRQLMRLPNEAKVDVLNWLAREAASPEKRAQLDQLEIGVEYRAIDYLLTQLRVTDMRVKQAAAHALGRIGNRQVTPSLAALLTSGDSALVESGREVLASFDGPISIEIVKVLPRASMHGKLAGLALLGQRKSSDQFNAVMALTKDEHAVVREAAYRTLQDVVSEQDFTKMCGLLETAEPSYVELIQQAVIGTLSNLSPSQQREQLFRRMLQAGDSMKSLYYIPLSSTGDREALRLIVEGFENSQGATKEAAFDALLQWRGFDAAEPLFAISQDTTLAPYAERALEAYVKVVSQATLTGEDRLILLRQALEATKSERLRRTILRDITQSGTSLALIYAGEWLDDPSLQETAAHVVMNIALAHPEYHGAEVRTLLEKASATLNNPDAEYQRQSIRDHLDKMPKDEENGHELLGNPVD